MQINQDFVERIFGPVTIDDFFSDYWEKTLLHIQRDKPDYFSSLLSRAGIEKLLAERNLYFPDVQMTQHNRTIAAEDYTSASNRISALRVVEQHKLGATLVLSHAHRQFGELNDLCRQLQLALQMRCQTNVYLSPPGNQGFKAHYDTHDVIIVQVQGSKTFNFYTGGPELPFADETFDPSLIPDIRLEKSVVLKAGDTLYIPRGVVHDAVTEDPATGPSLHITVGLFPVVVRDVLQEMVQVLSEQDSFYRQSLSRKAGVSLSLADGRQLSVSQLQEALCAALDLDVCRESLSRLRDEMSVQSDQYCVGLLTGDLDKVGLEDQLAVNKDMVLSVETSADRITVRTFGQVMEFAAPMSKAVDWILQQDHFTTGAVPGMSPEQASALVRRLTSENIVGPAS